MAAVEAVAAAAVEVARRRRMAVVVAVAVEALGRRWTHLALAAALVPQVLRWFPQQARPYLRLRHLKVTEKKRRNSVLWDCERISAPFLPGQSIRLPPPLAVPSVFAWPCCCAFSSAAV